MSQYLIDELILAKKKEAEEEVASYEAQLKDPETLDYYLSLLKSTRENENFVGRVGQWKLGFYDLDPLSELEQAGFVEILPIGVVSLFTGFRYRLTQKGINFFDK